MTSLDTQSGAEQPAHQLRHPLNVTYIGGPTAIINVDGVRFLTDPTFDAPGKTYVIPRVGAQTKNSWVQVFRHHKPDPST